MKDLTLGEFSKILDYLIDNNHRLIDNNDTPISVCLEGEAGIGKTTVIQQLANDKQMTFVKINLAQLEEPADLVGFPVKEYKVYKGDEYRWISYDLIKHLSSEHQVTNESRMGYATPSWLPREFNPNGTILLLDDFSRCNNLIMQAIYEIINTGSYISWNLPKYTTIVLTSNPDTVDYNVTSFDKALQSRMITFNGIFDITEWAKWAEDFGLDGRAINFAIYYHEELFNEKDGVTLANARAYTTFCRAISGIENWSNEQSLALILEISSGCFLVKDNIVGTLFTNFIYNKLDKLISPQDIFNLEWKTAKEKLLDCLYDSNDNHRTNIAYLLSVRMLNYLDKSFRENNIKSDVVCKRIEEIMTNDKLLFSQDIMYSMIKTICNNHKAKTNNWFLNSTIRQILL